MKGGRNLDKLLLVYFIVSFMNELYMLEKEAHSRSLVHAAESYCFQKLSTEAFFYSYFVTFQ